MGGGQEPSDGQIVAIFAKIQKPLPRGFAIKSAQGATKEHLSIFHELGGAFLLSFLLKYRQKHSRESMWLKRQSGVPKATLAQLGSLETEVMERIWARGEISVRDLHDELAGRLAYTTLMTTLDRLYKKSLLLRRKQGKAFFYVPACTEQEYQEQLTGHLFGMVLRENKDSDAVLSCFV